MEPVKGGLLANVVDDAAALMKEAAPEMSIASWAIRFAASLDGVIYVLSGMSNLEQVEDNVSYMQDFQPLTQTEQDTIRKAVEVIRSKASISCTACRYCVEDCPQQIAIPDYFRLMNNVYQYGEPMLNRAKGRYAQFTEKDGKGKASECVKCGQCEGHCPQHLPITQYLENVAKTFE